MSRLFSCSSSPRARVPYPGLTRRTTSSASAKTSPSRQRYAAEAFPDTKKRSAPPTVCARTFAQRPLETFSRGSHPRNLTPPSLSCFGPPCQITWLTPPKGHTAGGTELTIYGSGFKRSALGKVSEGPLHNTFKG